MSGLAAVDPMLRAGIAAGPEIAVALFLQIDLVFLIEETLLREEATDLLSSISSGDP